MKLKQRLLPLADEAYAAFNKKLVNTRYPILGVRMPALRKLAKELVQEEGWASVASADSFSSYEEVMLTGLVIAGARCKEDERLRLLKGFVPRIDNWAVCDCVTSSLKTVPKKRELYLPFIDENLRSPHEFSVRFALVLLLDHFIEADMLPRIFSATDSLTHDGYYVKMGAAWLISICFVKYPAETLAYLKDNSLDLFTYNKALQKIIESNRVDTPTKALMRSMKRKSNQ